MIRRSFLAATAAVTLVACAPTATGPGNLLTVAQGAGSFTTLLAAAQAAGMASALTGTSPLTVFAPTDAAFNALPAGTLTNLLKPENKDALTNILSYHIVPGVVKSDALVGRNVSTSALQGGKLLINGTDGVKVNGANVITPDVAASNGVIHVIDKVLLP